MGWEVADAERARCAGRLGSKRPAFACSALPAATADERRVREIIALRGSGRQPARSVSRRANRLGSVQARPRHFRIPHRPARHGPRRDERRAHRRACCRSIRTCSAFASSDYTLRPFKAYFFHLNPRHHSFAMVETGHEQRPSPDDRAVHARRRRAGVRSRARRGRPHCDDARAALERFHDVVLRATRRRGSSSNTAGADGRSIRRSGNPVEMTCGPSLWGHDRTGCRPKGARRPATCGCTRPRTDSANRCR